ncbi:1-phosphatidylinositol 4,5-bisphosphate phosphodiesterase eta-1, partial [Colius striatus]
VERCMSVMQSGTQMVKLKSGTKGLVRLFYLDEHRTCIRWRPSRKSEKAKIVIDSIYKVTEGRQSEIFHRHAEGNFDPSCCFTIYHGNHMESLDLITSNPEEARTWITGLKYLMAGISDEDSLAKRQRTHDHWVKQTFEEADKNGDGLLNIEEIHQLMHKLNVNLPRRKVRQMFQEADTDENQGTLNFEEFSVFYKMMSLRRDLYLLLLSYSDKKDHLTVEELAQFLKVEQKMNNVTPEYCLDIIQKFEVSEENKKQNVLGIEGFTNFMRSPACDIFNPLHCEVHQDMDQPLCNYFIASSHNTYLTGDQLLSQSRVEMYARVLQDGCRCIEVDCWDGPDGEPVVHHGYTLTSKILFRDVAETIDKYAFIKNEFPVILSIENHCSIQQQKKIAQYLKDIFGDKLDLSSVITGDSRQLPSPQNLKGKILVKGKKLPYSLGADAEEGEVSDEDSADEIEDDCKLKPCYSNGATEHQVESFIRTKLDSLMKESQIRDKEDPDSFTVRALLKATHEGLNVNLKQNLDTKEGGKKSHGRSLMGNFGKHKKAVKAGSKYHSASDEEESQQNSSGKEVGQLHSRLARRRKTVKLCRALSDLVVYTNSVSAQDIVDDGSTGNVLSFSETRAHQAVQQKAEQFMLYNQKQLTRVYPSAYRIDSSNFNPLPYWNVGCQLVALNYQSKGRVMQLNEAKFRVNGNCGYVLKPQQMCKGTFNPYSADPLPASPKKQLILKIISGQQLPKPPDSMLGDRGEIIDPFVEVEIIGLPVDCCKDQTRVVDDNGFNPVWEETLTFTIHMPEVALVRFLVWDHDPIGRDFVGQRTLAFSSLVPGYRHVYLEGLTEASIFVHITINDIYGKNKQLIGLRGLFNKNPKHSCAESSGHCVRKRSIGDRILRRTASAPAKGRKKSKMGFLEASEIKDSASEPLDLKDKDGLPCPEGETAQDTKGKENTSGTESEMDSALSALIGQLDVTDDQSHLTTVSGLHGTSSQTFSVMATLPHVLASNPNSPCKHNFTTTKPVRSPLFSTPDTTVFSSPETAEYSVYTIIHEATLTPASECKTHSELICNNKVKSVENNVPGSPCPSPLSFLNANPKRKCGTQAGTSWEAPDSAGSFASNNLIFEETLVDPLPGENSESSSLVEVDGDSQDLLVTACEYRREEMSQLASPLKLRQKQDIERGDKQKNVVCASERSQLDVRSPVLRNALAFPPHSAIKQTSPCKSKSLGDLTSEDISCNFESKYQYISRSFISSGMRDKKLAAMKNTRPHSTDALTEQLRKLVSLDQEDSRQTLCSRQVDEECPKALVRKLSSRSQSRVRNIATRAKERQE